MKSLALKGFSITTSTIGSGRSNMALSKLISAILFSGEPKVFRNAKSFVGRIPSGTISNNPSPYTLSQIDSPCVQIGFYRDVAFVARFWRAEFFQIRGRLFAKPPLCPVTGFALWLKSTLRTNRGVRNAIEADGTLCVRLE